MADAPLEHAGRIAPERLAIGDVEIAAREPDISEHVIVQIREAREFPAKEEPPPASRQHRGAVADPRGQANRREQLDKSDGSFRDIGLHAGLPLVRASGFSTSSRLLKKNWVARLTLERESDSCAVEKQQEESMRGSDLRTGELFSYIDLEQRVPESHPLRLIRCIVNQVLAALDGEFGKLYAAEGRPSIAPERLL